MTNEGDTMMTNETPIRTGQGRKRRVAARLFATTVLGATLFGAGYWLGNREGGAPIRELDELSSFPPASSFLDYPNTYAISVRANDQQEREVYLQDKKSGVEWPLPDELPELLTASSGMGGYVLRVPMSTISGVRWLYEKLGGAPAGPRPISEGGAGKRGE